jgi:UDP-N-acetylmuramoylalanine--D-glutamate ligase
MYLRKLKIGIWGFGVTGKAMLPFVAREARAVGVMEKRTLTPEEKELLLTHHAALYTQEQIAQFFTDHDVVLPSPGIPLHQFGDYKKRCISELDLLAAFYHRPIFAVTGTIGKTTVTALLGHLLSQHFSLFVGGNIGTGTFELLNNPHAYELALLELSSFELQLNRSFAPALALWTNFYPNHLDYHTDEDDYFAAKCNILMHQSVNGLHLVPLALAPRLPATKGQRAFFHPTEPTAPQRMHIGHDETLYFVHNSLLYKEQKGTKQTVIDLSAYPQPTYQDNCALVASALDLLGLPVTRTYQAIETFQAHDHRLQKVATKNGIDFYNDSKSTVAQATVAAVEQLQGKPIILLLGGLSKGINREPLIAQLSGKVQAIVCFGAEAAQLAQWCLQYHIKHTVAKTLEEAVDQAKQIAASGAQIVLSPAGTSYDLFKDYKERGKRFIELI